MLFRSDYTSSFKDSENSLTVSICWITAYRYYARHEVADNEKYLQLQTALPKTDELKVLTQKSVKNAIAALLCKMINGVNLRDMAMKGHRGITESFCYEEKFEGISVEQLVNEPYLESIQYIASNYVSQFGDYTTIVKHDKSNWILTVTIHWIYGY